MDTEDVNLDDEFPPAFFTKDNVARLAGNAVQECAAVGHEMVGSEKDKHRELVMAFVGLKTKLILKRAHAAILTKAFGNRSSQWVGATMRLSRNPVYGREYAAVGVLVTPVAPRAGTADRDVPAADGPPPYDDDVPFPPED
jgi:hypothetical protein